MSSRKKRKKRNFRIFMLVVILTLAVASVALAVNKLVDINSENGNNQANDNQQINSKDDVKIPPSDNPNDTNSDDKNPEQKSEDIIINIAATGDLMFHPSQIEGAYDKTTKTYDFTNSFKAVKPIFEKADLAVANFEGTTAGDEDYAYQGYPLFNAPDEVLDAIKDAGFDVLSTVNNHSLDTRKNGIIKTIEKIKQRGMDTVGTYVKKPETRVIIKDVKGIKVAFLAYTEMVNGLESVMKPEDLDAMVNIFDETKMKEDIAYAKKQNADTIIAILHWGNEYNRTPSQRQKSMADMLFKEGVNIILGSHPHVVQPSENLEYDGKRTFVIYSMGNFISNQRVETLTGDVVEPQYTEDGIIVNIEITKKGETGDVSITDVSYTPLWVYKGKSADGRVLHVTYPILEYIESNDLDEKSKQRMDRSYNDTMVQMDNKYNN